MRHFESPREKIGMVAGLLFGLLRRTLSGQDCSGNLSGDHLNLGSGWLVWDKKCLLKHDQRLRGNCER